VCLLKILWSGWFFGKHLLTMCRNFLPRLVLTFEAKGGLYHVMFLVRFLLFLGGRSGEGLYVSLWSYPGGGVGVYARQTYKVKVLDDISNISDNGLHQLWINLQVRNLKSIVICTMYRPPDTPLTCFDTYLTPSLITASLQNKPIYILGDGNCDILKPDCRGAIALTNFCHSFNLSQLVSLY